MEGLDLQREAPLDVFEAEVACGGVSGFDNVEEVGVGVGGEEGEAGGLTPCRDPVGVEVVAGVAGRAGRGGGERLVAGRFEVDVVFDRGEEGEEVFFELQPDEFLRAHVPERSGSTRVGLVPGGGDGLCEKVNPASVGRREGERVTKGGGSDVDGAFVELRKRRVR